MASTGPGVRQHRERAGGHSMHPRGLVWVGVPLLHPGMQHIGTGGEPGREMTGGETQRHGDSCWIAWQGAWAMTGDGGGLVALCGWRRVA